MSRASTNAVTKRRRTKDGCRPCRMRKKKCDGRKPNCVSCERNVLLCSWFTPGNDGDDITGSEGGRQATQKYTRPSMCPDNSHRSLVPAFPESRKLEACPVPIFQSSSHARDINTLLRQPALEPIFRTPASLLLYQHWIERTGEAMSARRGTFNAFVTELPRLAIAYPDTVLQGLLACSGVHYGNANPGREIETSTWTHLGVALRSLKHGLTKLVSRTETDPVPLLATALVLCFVETTRGDESGVLSHHLRAAHILFDAVLKSPSTPLMDQSILEFLKEFYIYITRITEISSNEIIQLDDQYQPIHHPRSASPWVSNKSFGILVGCAHELFDLIPQVSALARERRRKYSSEGDNTQQAVPSPATLDDNGEDLAYYSLLAKILAWVPPESSPSDFATAGKIHQQALLCYLDISCANPPISAQSELPESIQGRFYVLNNLLAELPLDAPISSTLCWPLALFGSVARDEYQRAIILGRLEAMWGFLHIGNIMSTMNLLKRLWDDKRLNDFPAPEIGYPNNTAVALRRQPHSISKRAADPSDMEALMKKYALMISFV
ncbi:hypothetical protein FQN57_000150 [Myotisia sp. PD_48]|nr:hypothetical protein FQN57_000150 [Myotisia sp. PD_48]